MNTDSSHAKPIFCDDAALGYQRNRSRFLPDQPLLLDAAYRLAHLPLVNPSHRDVIPGEKGRDYDMGLHGPVHSLVLPVPQVYLDASLGYQTLLSAVRESIFNHKIAWDIVERRRGLLHATLCGSLGRAEASPSVSDDVLSQLRALGPMAVELRGLFSGNVNVGRIYLKAYPVRHGGTHVFHSVQQIMGRPLTDLYLIGLFNLTDHLNGAETQALAQLVEDWWNKPILSFAAQELWLLTSRDDLVLDSVVSQRIALSSAG
jgi:hypothetical protein